MRGAAINGTVNRFLGRRFFVMPKIILHPIGHLLSDRKNYFPGVKVDRAVPCSINALKSPDGAADPPLPAGRQPLQRQSHEILSARRLAALLDVAHCLVRVDLFVTQSN